MNRYILGDLEKMYKEKYINWAKLYGRSVLISGAYGMLASYMVYMLLYLNKYYNADIEIYAVGRNEQKFFSRFGEFIEDKHFHIVLQDINKPVIGIPKIDYIIHAASPASPHYYATIPVDVILPNILGTYNLLEKAVEDKVLGFLFISSGPYGNLEGKVESIKETDMGPLDPMNLRSCYDEGKRCGETLCLSYYCQYNVPINCVRPSHTYGPTMDLNDSRVFANFVSDAINGRDIVIKGDGRAMRSFCYISDAVLAYFKILLDARRGEAYNVGNDEANISIADLAKLIVSLCSKDNIKVVFANREKNDKYSVSPIVKAPILNTEKIRALGWKWTVSLEDGFARTIASFKAW